MNIDQKAFKFYFLLCFVLVNNEAYAKIKEDGLWSGFGARDFTIDDTNISVLNGIVYSENTLLNTRIQGAWYIEPLNYLQQENVLRVRSIFPEASF